MFRKFRQAHLWIGLISSILLFIEAGTGLLLMEPWMLGGSSERHNSFLDRSSFNQTGDNGGIQGGIQNETPNSPGDTNNNGGNLRERVRFPGGAFDGRFENSLLFIVRGIHSGHIGKVDIRWLIDLSAVSILFLTATGIYLSLKIIRAQRKAKLNTDMTNS